MSASTLSPSGAQQSLTLSPLTPIPPQGVNPEDWVVGFVRSGGFSQFCEAILTRGLFGDGLPEKMKMVDAQQACLVR